MEKTTTSLGKYISIIYRHGQIYINERLKPYGISSGQAIYLMALYRSDGISQETLCRKINIDKGTTARALKKLEDAGYITRQRDSSDKRAYKIYLTVTAHEFKETFRSIYWGWTDALSANMTGAQKKAAFQLLEAMAENACFSTRHLHECTEQEKLI